MSVAAAKLIEVADGITAKLRTGYEENAFPELVFKVDRNYADLTKELTEACTRVDVIPIRYDVASLADRGTLQYEVTNQIAVRRKFDQQDRNQAGAVFTAKVDRMVRFVEELHEFFVPNPSNPQVTLPTVPEAEWLETKILGTYSRPRLTSEGLFLAYLVLRFTIPKSLV